MPPWRNWLARSAVNRKVGGSNPPGGVFFIFFYIIQYKCNIILLIIVKYNICNISVIILYIN